MAQLLTLDNGALVSGRFNEEFAQRGSSDNISSYLLAANEDAVQAVLRASISLPPINAGGDIMAAVNIIRGFPSPERIFQPAEQYAILFRTLVERGNKIANEHGMPYFALFTQAEVRLQASLKRVERTETVLQRSGMVTAARQARFVSTELNPPIAIYPTVNLYGSA